MRQLSLIPALAIVIAAYNAFCLLGGMFDSESLLFSWVLPSTAELFIKAGDLFVMAGLLALFFEVLKAARTGTGTIVDHILSTIVFIVALVEFLLVGYCGTATFFFLMLMTLIDLVGGFVVSLLAARRDYAVTRENG